MEGEDLLSAGGNAVDFDGSEAGGTNNDNGIQSWAFTSGYLDVPITLPSSGTYEITVHVYGARLSDDVKPILSVSLNTPTAYSGSNGETLIKQQLLDMHSRFLGETLTTESDELKASYDLFVNLWQTRWNNHTEFTVEASDQETCTTPEGQSFSEDQLIDSQHLLATWSRMLLYFMTDYKYLHE